MTDEKPEIPQYLKDAYEKVCLQEYGYAVTNRIYQWNYETPVLTRKQKIQRKIAHKKWEIGRYLSNKANELGYYDDSY